MPCGWFVFAYLFCDQEWCSVRKCSSKGCGFYHCIYSNNCNYAAILRKVKFVTGRKQENYTWVLHSAIIFPFFCVFLSAKFSRQFLSCFQHLNYKSFGASVGLVVFFLIGSPASQSGNHAIQDSFGCLSVSSPGKDPSRKICNWAYTSCSANRLAMTNMISCNRRISS